MTQDTREREAAPSRSSQVIVPIVVAVIGGIATVVAASLGARGAFDDVVPGAAGTASTGTTATVTASASPVPGGTVTVTVAAPTEGRPPASEGVRHQGEVRMASATRIDLDSPAGEVQWRQDKDLPPGAAYDVYMGSGSISNAGSAQIVKVADANADCAQESGYGSNRYAAARGSTFCVKTSEDRYSLVRVLSEPDKDDGSLQIGATTYEAIVP